MRWLSSHRLLIRVRKPEKNYFLKLPISVIEDDHFGAMSKPGRDALWTLAKQYRGKNNGDLMLTRGAVVSARASMRARDQGRREAEAAGFIVTVRTGARYQKTPTRFALAFQPLDFGPNGKRLDKSQKPKIWLREKWAIEAQDYAIERWEVIKKTLADAEARRKRRKMIVLSSEELERRPPIGGIHGPEKRATTAIDRGHPRPRKTGITAPSRRHNLESRCTCEVPEIDIVESGVQPGSDGTDRHFLATSRSDRPTARETDRKR